MTFVRRLFYIAIVLLIPTINSCGGDPSFSLATINEKLSQDTLDNKQISKVDILWLIDNSSSMATAQKNITDNFSSFIENFSTLNLDFQIGVAATDSHRANENLTTNFDATAARLRDGDRSKAGSGVYILNNDTPDLNSTFVKNATLGILGDGDERAFSSLESFFKEPFNNGFLRKDSYLAIIIVSDEDDLSYDGKSPHERLGGGKPDLYTTDRFINFLDSATESTGIYRRYGVSSIHIKTDDVECLRKLRIRTQRYGTRYEELIQALGGTEKNIISLCSDFADSLSDLSQTIIDGVLKPIFKINRKPIVSSIVVRVNDRVVPRSINGSEGWTYDNPEKGVYHIIFTKKAIPPSGASVDIQFDPAGFDE